MRHSHTPNADRAAEIVARGWGVKRKRNTNVFVGEPAYAYKMTRREGAVVYKAYLGEAQWTLEAQGQEVSGKRFMVSFGAPFNALVLTAPLQGQPSMKGLDVFTFPEVDGKPSPFAQDNSWLLTHMDFRKHLEAFRLTEGEMLAVTMRCLFVRLKMGSSDDVARRLAAFEGMLAWLRAVKS